MFQSTKLSSFKKHNKAAIATITTVSMYYVFSKSFNFSFQLKVYLIYKRTYLKLSILRLCEK